MLTYAGEYYASSSISRVILRLRWLRHPHLDFHTFLLQHEQPWLQDLAGAGGEGGAGGGGQSESASESLKSESEPLTSEAASEAEPEALQRAAAPGAAAAEWRGVRAADEASCCPGGTEVNKKKGVIWHAARFYVC